MSKSVSLEEAAGFLLRHQRILVLAHQKPDGDALGSVLGMRSFLRNLGKQADALFPSPLPERYRSFAGPVLTALSRQEAERNYDLIVLLDCANAERIACGPALDADFLRSRNLLNIDHHVGNNVGAPYNYIDSTASAASEIAVELAQATGKAIPVEAATLWYLGILTDTGSFRFTNTTGKTLRLAADLLDAGADSERVVNAVYFSKPRRQQQFEAELLQSCVKTALDGRYAYASIPPELFAKYDFDMRDGEGLIDLLREIDGTVVAALIYRKNDSYKVSMRSKLREFPVGPIARSLGQEILSTLPEFLSLQATPLCTPYRILRVSEPEPRGKGLRNHLRRKKIRKRERRKGNDRRGRFLHSRQPENRGRMHPCLQ